MMERKGKQHNAGRRRLRLYTWKETADDPCGWPGAMTCCQNHCYWIDMATGIAADPTIDATLMRECHVPRYATNGREEKTRPAAVLALMMKPTASRRKPQTGHRQAYA